MSFLKNIFLKKDEPIKSYEDFWKWFMKNERDFFKAVKARDNNINANFFSKLSPKLDELKEGFYFLSGMANDTTAELVITADGAIKNIVFVEELVNAAPKINGWLFTALKPATETNIDMAGYKFNCENISFYANEDSNFPDDIDLTIVHDDFNDGNKSDITRGVYIFLDNFLGELNFATTIDNLKVIGRPDAKKELILIEKLKSYLDWRQSEFVEKYKGSWHNDENDEYSGFDADLKSGKKLIAVINTDLLNWDRKASHPWILSVGIKYAGQNDSGLPDEKTYELLEGIDDEIRAALKFEEGYLNIGRQTSDNLREIYFACKEFRKASKVADEIARRYSDRFGMSYEIYKDKYWRSFDRFVPQ